MKPLLTILLFVLLFSSNSLCQGEPEKKAKEAASQWLSLVDAADYATSWDQAAPAFQRAVSKAQWTQMLQVNRAPLGKLLSRSVKSAVYRTSLPGAPDGQYVVIQYETSFEHKKSAIETVTPSQGDDGKWRVSGYFIR
jgi:hypothetical protein